LQFRPFPILL
jgi:hypothetical protein